MAIRVTATKAMIDSIVALTEEIRLLKMQNHNLKQELPDGHHWKEVA
jgi:hypothetical protein